MDINDSINHALERIKLTRPLIHHITNYVVMNETANATLAMGASPVMAHAIEEVEEITSAASALVLNIGTLTPELIDAMIAAGKVAIEKNIPIILDPVGAGASKLRTESCKRLISELGIAVIRANSSEAAVLAGLTGNIKGVDAVECGLDMDKTAHALSLKCDCVAAVTGATDIICDHDRLTKVKHGHPMMTMVTGTGCIATTVVAIFASVVEDPFIAAAAALAFYGIAGEKAALTANKKPGTYHVALYDALAHLSSYGASGARLEVFETSIQP